MILNLPWQSIHKVKCPDGSIKTYYRDIDKAFPLALKDNQIKFDADLILQKQTSAKLKTEYASKIQRLLFTITEQNQSLMLHFRTTYVGYQSDPCANNAFLLRQIEHATSRQHKLMELKMKIEGLIRLLETQPMNTKDFTSAYQDILNEIDGKHDSEAATLEIKNNRELATEWAKKKDDE